MAEPARNFEIVEDEPDTQPQPATSQSAPRIGEKLALDVWVMAISALSKRALVALASLFTLLTVGSAFWLWWCIPDPNTNQIIALSIYALFVLAANWIVRRNNA